jgi:hypothetical protein
MLRQMEQFGDNIVSMQTNVRHEVNRLSQLYDTAVSQYFHDKEIAIARLAMLIECEGTIGIGMTPPTKTRNRPALCPAVSVGNTAMAIIDEAIDTLTGEGIEFTFMPNIPASGLGTMPKHGLHLHGFHRVSTLLTALLPFLRSKKPQAELVLEFIRSRRNSNLKNPYSDREWQITTEVRLLNRCHPQAKALAKAKAYIASPTDPNRARTAEYFRKYIEMCNTLQDAL